MPGVAITSSGGPPCGGAPASDAEVKTDRLPLPKILRVTEDGAVESAGTARRLKIIVYPIAVVNLLTAEQSARPTMFIPPREVDPEFMISSAAPSAPSRSCPLEKLDPRPDPNAFVMSQPVLCSVDDGSRGVAFGS